MAGLIRESAPRAEEMELLEMSDFHSRNEFGQPSEQLVRSELEQRGWLVHPWGRSSFPAAINNALSVWKDTYSRPSRLRWLPDLLAMRPGDPQSFRAVEVKRHGGHFGIARSAVNTYLRLESALWVPVQIVFHCPESNDGDTLRVIPAGECVIASQPKPGNPEYGSGDPQYWVDVNRTQPFDSVFGVKP
jgi:hypothetical protein